MPNISLRVNDELHERIDEQAERFGISRSEFIRAGIFRMLDGTGPQNQRDDDVIRPVYDRGRHGWEIESELFIPLEAVELTQSERLNRQESETDSGESLSISGDPDWEVHTDDGTGNENDNIDAVRMSTLTHASETVQDLEELESDWGNFADTIRDISEDSFIGRAVRMHQDDLVELEEMHDELLESGFGDEYNLIYPEELPNYTTLFNGGPSDMPHEELDVDEPAVVSGDSVYACSDWTESDYEMLHDIATELEDIQYSDDDEAHRMTVQMLYDTEIDFECDPLAVDADFPDAVEGEDMGVPDLDDEPDTIAGIPVVESGGESAFEVVDTDEGPGIEFEFEIQEHDNGDLEFRFPNGVNGRTRVELQHPMNQDPPITDVRELWADEYWYNELTDFGNIVCDLVRDHAYDIWDIEPDHGHYFHVTVDVLTYSARYPEGELIMPMDELLNTAESAMCFDYSELDISEREYQRVREVIARQIWNDNAEHRDGYGRWDDPTDPPDVLQEEPPEFEFHEHSPDLVPVAEHFYPVEELWVEHDHDRQVYRCAPRSRGPFEVPEERLVGINSRVALFEMLQERAPDIPVADLAYFGYVFYSNHPRFPVDDWNVGFFEAVALLDENPYNRAHYIGDMMQEIWEEPAIQRFATLYTDEWTHDDDLDVLQSWQEHDFNHPQVGMCISQFPDFGDYFDFVASELENNGHDIDNYL